MQTFIKMKIPFLGRMVETHSDVILESEIQKKKKKVGMDG